MDSIQRNLSYCGEAKGTKDTEVLNRMEDELQLAGEEIEYLEINIQEKNMKCLEQEEKIQDTEKNICSLNENLKRRELEIATMKTRTEELLDIASHHSKLLSHYEKKNCLDFTKRCSLM